MRDGVAGELLRRGAAALLCELGWVGGGMWLVRMGGVCQAVCLVGMAFGCQATCYWVPESSVREALCLQDEEGNTMGVDESRREPIRTRKQQLA